MFFPTRTFDSRVRKCDTSTKQTTSIRGIVSIIPSYLMDINHGWTAHGTESFLEKARQPIHERVLNQLANLLLEADDLLSVLQIEEASRMRWMEATIQNIYDDVNNIMKRISD